jgi:hypothetical protein
MEGAMNANQIINMVTRIVMRKVRGYQQGHGCHKQGPQVQATA